MRRTLLEILGATAAVVLVTSFHQQNTRLRTQSQDVASLRQLVEASMEKTSDRETDTERQQALEQLEERLRQLEGLLAQATAHGDETAKLRAELRATKLEADLFRTDIARDVTRTKELVDAYHQEFRALDRRAAAGLIETQASLRTLAARVAPNPALLSADLLQPTVQLNGDDTVGSGTLVHSEANADGSIESYVLTSYHVVRNIFADTPSARRTGIALTIYTDQGKTDEHADMVCHDEALDAALLKLRSDRLYKNTARTIARDRASTVQVWERIYTVGCPLGNDPIPTTGEISSKTNELNGSNYWMINAPTYFGNSGGGVFLAGSRELVGVFSKIYTHGKGNPVVVPHMGLCTPMDLIYGWLEREKLSHVLHPPSAPVESGLAAPPSGN